MEAASVEVIVLDRIVEVGLLRPVGPFLQFSHDLVRQAVAAELTPSTAPPARIRRSSVRSSPRRTRRRSPCVSCGAGWRARDCPSPRRRRAAAVATGFDSHKEARRSAQSGPASWSGRTGGGARPAVVWIPRTTLFVLDQVAEARQAAETAVELAERTDDTALQGRSLVRLAKTAGSCGGRTEGISWGRARRGRSACWSHWAKRRTRPRVCRRGHPAAIRN